MVTRRQKLPSQTSPPTKPGSRAQQSDTMDFSKSPREQENTEKFPKHKQTRNTSIFPVRLEEEWVEGAEFGVFGRVQMKGKVNAGWCGGVFSAGLQQTPQGANRKPRFGSILSTKKLPFLGTKALSSSLSVTSNQASQICIHSLQAKHRVPSRWTAKTPNFKRSRNLPSKKGKECVSHISPKLKIAQSLS